MARCPFIDPAYELSMTVPCPVCGDLGEFTDEPKCIATPAEVAEIMVGPSAERATVGGEK